MTKDIPYKSLLIALLLHLFVFWSMATVITIKPDENPKSPEAYSVPSYITNGAMQSFNTPKLSQTKSFSASKSRAIMRPTTQKAIPALKSMSLEEAWGIHPPTTENESHKNKQMQAETKHENAEPLLLVGDPNVEASPLVKIVGRAISANFNYPRMEGSFGIRGKVLVELILHPEGYFSDVHIIQSSNNQNFDTAALYAIHKAPKMVGVNLYLKKPKDIIIGFLFN